MAGKTGERGSMGFICGEGRGYRKRKDSPSCAFVDLTVIDDDEQLPAKDGGICTIEDAEVPVRKWMCLCQKSAIC